MINSANYILLFLLGISIGSFLNVVIDRIPGGKSIIRGRSNCDYCHHRLSFLDLIPVLSFLLLGGKCRYCKKKISFQYPVVEFFTGVSFIFVFVINNSHFQLTINNQQLTILIYHLIVISLLIAIFVTDLKYQIIPDQLIIFLVIISFLFDFFFLKGNFNNYLFSAFGNFLLFLTIFLVTRGRGMGFGDVKFSFAMGLLLGYPFVIVSFYIAFLTGAAISLILILVGQKTMKSRIAFGPFLAGATAVSLFYGQSIWEVFKGIMGI